MCNHIEFFNTVEGMAFINLAETLGLTDYVNMYCGEILITKDEITFELFESIGKWLKIMPNYGLVLTNESFDSPCGELHPIDEGEVDSVWCYHITNRNLNNWNSTKYEWVLHKPLIIE